MRNIKIFLFSFFMCLCACMSAQAETIAQEDCNAAFDDVDLQVTVPMHELEGGGHKLALTFANQGSSRFEFTGVEPDHCKAVKEDIKMEPSGEHTIQYLCDSTFDPSNLRVTFYARNLADDQYSPALRVCDVVTN